ncbi:TIGR01459 family HAD-type hydrolase [Kaistia dalseonensis]|uniref:HAD superfamily hydrolase (TIGR01459 family) n=1 Tax=Kaistia dalseonensis TaxID=410840 RepID=A0ABU0HES6_9HYPH|nr:TIGR01459 family HAD-type hydrolase [Kaistia dalseonensis]MCX5497342.1 TIGR01459 family HAD-type hydrolase [Kaistia dalseonensis]MDQ0439979.1 HAD superfamily hydrolase (TIGR01459 family) [Kaistia dalseonensis]
MTNSISPPRIAGLSALSPLYPVLLCDVWGVLHNGVVSSPPARNALLRHREAGGTVVLITNAPRLSPFVVEQISDLGVEPECYDAIVTSGDVTRALLAARGPVKTLHIGTDQHLTLYDGLDLELVEADAAEIISCTGLYDDEQESPDDYDAMLKSLAARGLPMICANPDIVVERGHKLIWCAGALAERYRSFGGTTFIAGKPHAPIYDEALTQAARIRGDAIARERVLAIGDGAPTDLKGAYSQGLDVLFVSGGIHAASFGPAANPDGAAVSRFMSEEKLGARAYLPSLVW